ncbi:hypothetical protein INS90_01790 [Trueperella pecoris]|uniref:Lipoprotein n=1 Tax=Trueperella pecoris TaxID=2733571 RepID=A0A7M1R1L8_9ACTO|nr:hypothetical protein [Trueperella pecoris]QOR48056.1 hypothetical protein INS90_01790 [Trueperella pecoris]
MNMRRFLASTTALFLAVSLAACGSSKPSKSAVIDGLSPKVSEQAKGDERLEKTGKDFAKCVVEATYDDLSESSLEAMSKGEDKLSNKDDEAKLKEAAAKCMPGMFGK